MVKTAFFSPLYSTREPEMKYQRQGDVWRFVSVQDGREAAVGFQYASKAELLADCHRYLTEWGY
jgi:hypothetical protein